MAKNMPFKVCAICAVAVIYSASFVTSQHVDIPSTLPAVFKRYIRDIKLPTVSSESDVLEVPLSVTPNGSNEPSTTSTTPISPSPIVESPTTLPLFDRPTGAFFSCLSIVYPEEDSEMLYPPSETSLDLFSDLGQAQHQHEMTLNNFCNKSTQYSECLTTKINNPTDQMEYMIKNVSDVANFGKTFNEFCARKEIVISQFNCTYRATKEYPKCNGGMNDFMTTISNMGATSWFMCKKLRKSRECRVTHQLKPCGEEYAMVMEEMLAGVLNEPCRAGELIYPDNDYTDLAPCFVEYMANSTDRMSQAFGNQNPDGFAILSFVLDEIYSMCRDNKHAIFACMSKILKDSTAKIDTIMKKLFSVDNMIKIFDFFKCVIMPDLKRNAQCLIVNYKRTDNTSNDVSLCLSEVKEDVTQGMSLSTSSIHLIPLERLCMGLYSAMKCYTPILSGCDKNIQYRFDQLLEGLKNSCNNPGYTLEFNSGPVSSYLPSVPILVGALMLTTYLVN